MVSGYHSFGRIRIAIRDPLTISQQVGYLHPSIKKATSNLAFNAIRAIWLLTAAGDKRPHEGVGEVSAHTSIYVQSEAVWPNRGFGARRTQGVCADLCANSMQFNRNVNFEIGAVID